MDWLKENYEKAVLGALALGLLGCATWIVLQTLSFPDMFAERNSPKRPDNTIAPPNVAAVEQAATATTTPRGWDASEGSLFVSRPYVLKDGNLVDPLEEGQDLHPPIKNAWLIRYNLDYADPGVKDQDPDQDRFANLEEFLAGTDPTNPNSVPPYHTKLRLVKFDPKPFRLKFSGTPDEGQTFTINTKDLGGRTQFLQLGEMIEGAPYKLLSYEPKSTTRNEMQVDVSELTIQNTETGQKIVLVFDKEADDPTSYGEFLYLYDNSRLRVKKDDEFTLTPETDRKYKLIDISAAEAQIQDLATGEKVRVGKAE
ncbi:MAG: Amuc_1099 family pilus-like system protein [Terrimicrobiaceae bacterium]|nr:Amuc_1099 family pilus-like system protein [Terrimicrobiaceae bacterium]